MCGVLSPVCVALFCSHFSSCSSWNQHNSILLFYLHHLKISLRLSLRLLPSSVLSGAALHRRHNNNVKHRLCSISPPFASFLVKQEVLPSPPPPNSPCSQPARRHGGQWGHWAGGCCLMAVRSDSCSPTDVMPDFARGHLGGADGRMSNLTSLPLTSHTTQRLQLAPCLIQRSDGVRGGDRGSWFFTHCVSHCVDEERGCVCWVYWVYWGYWGYLPFRVTAF